MKLRSKEPMQMGHFKLLEARKASCTSQEETRDESLNTRQLKSCSRWQTDHHVLISLEILLLLLSINSPFVHPVESTQYFDTLVTEFGSTNPLLTILVSFLS